MIVKDMVEQLQILAEKGEIPFEDVPKVVKVANWITRYAASLKKHPAETAIKESDTTNESDTTRNFNKFQETKKRNNEKSEKISYNTTIIAKIEELAKNIDTGLLRKQYVTSNFELPLLRLSPEGHLPKWREDQLAVKDRRDCFKEYHTRKKD
ncbi:7104_t:CDS:2, partial [Gigaspora rosea]